MVNGYKMVPQSTPMRQATSYQKRAVVEQSPMITWGKIEGTMFLGMEKSPFRIAETSKREELAINLGNKVQAKKREIKEQEK
jgi:hypothetical protein